MRIDVVFLRDAATLSSIWQPSEVEWPPHPDRVFQALVAAWGGSGREPAAAEALRWLEKLDSPAVIASAATCVTPHAFFVPTNDKPFAKRKERRRPTAYPDDPVVSYLWQDADPGAHRSALVSLCRHASRLGHSSSLVLLQVADDASPQRNRQVFLPSNRGVPMRVPGRGRFDDLIVDYERGERPRLAATIPYAEEQPQPEAHLPAFDEIIALRGREGRAPPLGAIPLVAEALRNALMRHCALQPPPEVLSGHHPDGAPARLPHMATIPLANVGWDWSDGRLMGLGIVLPRGIEAADRRVILQALATWLHGEAKGRLSVSGRDWWMEHAPEPEQWSLRPDRYQDASRTWASVTPTALDRHPKRPGDAERSLAEACVKIGLPAPAEIRIGRQSNHRGAPWVGDFAFRGRRLVHARLRFESAVGGPIMLGAGRFRGLGLMLPLDGRVG